MTTTTQPVLRDGTWTVRPGDAVAAFTVRKLGLIRVHGTIPVAEGSVTVRDARPVAAAASLEPTSVRTGIRKRDADLQGRSFFRTAEHPRIDVRTTAIEPDGNGWLATSVLAVAGGEAPVELRVESEPGPDPEAVRIRITAVLDRAGTPIRAPRWLVGRHVGIEVWATLDRPR